MEASITREEGHAHVAAIRVLRYRLGRLPTVEEVAEILGSKVEITNHRLRTLQGLGIISLVENPFEVHACVENHLALEELPLEANEDVLADAVQEFQKRQSEKADEMMRVFEDSDEKRDKKRKHERMADELKRFKKKKPGRAPWEASGPDE